MDDLANLQTNENVEFQTTDYVEITADIVSAYLAHNRVPMAELPSLLMSTPRSLASTRTSKHKNHR